KPWRAHCPRLVVGAVRGIANDRPAASGEMDANLVTAAGDETATQQREASRGRHTFVFRYARHTRRRDHDAPDVVPIASQGKIDRAARRLHTAVHDGQV